MGAQGGRRVAAAAATVAAAAAAAAHSQNSHPLLHPSPSPRNLIFLPIPHVCRSSRRLPVVPVLHLTRGQQCGQKANQRRAGARLPPTAAMMCMCAVCCAAAEASPSAHPAHPFHASPVRFIVRAQAGRAAMRNNRRALKGCPVLHVASSSHTAAPRNCSPQPQQSRLPTQHAAAHRLRLAPAVLHGLQREVAGHAPQSNKQRKGG